MARCKRPSYSFVYFHCWFPMESHCIFCHFSFFVLSHVLSLLIIQSTVLLSWISGQHWPDHGAWSNIIISETSAWAWFNIIINMISAWSRFNIIISVISAWAWSNIIISVIWSSVATNVPSCRGGNSSGFKWTSVTIVLNLSEVTGY